MSDIKRSRAAAEQDAIEAFGARLGFQSRIRPNTTTSVPVLSNTDNLTKKTQYFGAPGTVTVFVGRSRASIDRVRAAVDEGGESVTAIVNEVLTPIDGDPTLEEALNTIAEAPVFSTLVYGGTPLVEHLCIPSGRDLMAFTLPYNGGRLAEQGFQLRQFYQPGADTHEAIALHTMPVLSRAEIAALEQVPDPDRWQNVGPLSGCSYACGAAVVGAYAGAVGGVYVGGILGGPVGAVAGGVGGGLAGAVLGRALYHSAAADALGGGGHNADNAANADAGNADAGHADAGNAGQAATGGINTIIQNLSLSDLEVQQLGVQGTARALLELRRVALLQSLGRG